MKIGVPKEIKNNENRVGMVPSGVKALSNCGHTVYVQHMAGAGSGFLDEEYRAAGAVILNTATEIYDSADMIVKVKEPLSPEYQLLRKSQILFTYLHLAAELPLTKVLVERGAVGIAYETIELEDHSLPLLAPMSEIAGRMSVQLGAQFLEGPNGGSGVLLGGVPGVAAGRVVVLGAGLVGSNAVKIAVGMGAQVTVVDIASKRLRCLDDTYGNRITTLQSNPVNIAQAVKEADLVIGAVLIPGAKAPCLVTEEMIKTMRPGSVVVDVAIDQGGCIETADKVSTHSDPCYVRHGVVHYSVANIPGAVSRTSTLALTGATLPYVLEIAEKGWLQAVKDSPALAKGVNIVNGKVTYRAVAEATGMEYTPLATVI